MRLITVVTTYKSTGKEAFIDDNNEISFRSLGANIEGHAQTIEASNATEFAALLNSLKQGQYIIPDYVPEAVSRNVDFEIVAAKKYAKLFKVTKKDPDFGALREHEGRFYVAKVMTPGVWVFGQWRLFDRDVDEQTPKAFRSMSDEQWLQHMDTMIPGFSECEYLIAASTKSRVCFAGKPETAVASTNAHIFVLCKNTHMSDRVRSSAKVMASERGLSWQKNNKLGHKSTALIFDTAVFTLHRDCYEAPPSIADRRLELLPRDIKVHEGKVLDLEKAFPKMTQERAAVSGAYKGKFEIDTEGRISESEYNSLMPDTIIELEDQTLSVLEFVESEAYECNVKYRCQAAFRDSSSWNGVLRKYIDARVMHYDQGTGISHWTAIPVWQPAAERYANSEGGPGNERLMATKALGIVLSTMTAQELEIHADDIKERSGATKAKIKALRKAGLGFKQETDEHKAIQVRMDAIHKARIEAAKSVNTRKDITELRTFEETQAELSANWCLILNQNETVAATFFFERNDQNFHELKFQTFKVGALRTFLTNTDLETEFGRVSAVDEWMGNRSRVGVRQVTFEPGLPRHFDGKLNLWTGWGIEPGETSDGCELFLNHVREVIASGDQKSYEYLLGWMATVVQRIYNRTQGKPLARTEIILVLRSIQGTGKGLFEQYFAKLFGVHALTTSKGHDIAGRFNWKFANQLLICADEAFFAGDHATYDAMKAFATDPFFDFEKKFQDSVTLPNHVSMIMSSNKDWVTPAELRDRRMCVLDVSDARVGNAEYFEALVTEMHGSGPKALFRYLLDYDLGAFAIRDYPRTEALASQIVQTLARDNALYSWLEDVLESGEFVVPHAWFNRRVTGCYYGGDPDCPFEPVEEEDSQSAAPPKQRGVEDPSRLANQLRESTDAHQGVVIHWPQHHRIRLPRGLIVDMINQTARNTYSKRSNKQVGFDLRKIGLIDDCSGLKVSVDTSRRDIYGYRVEGKVQQVNAWDLPSRDEAAELFARHLTEKRSG